MELKEQEQFRRQSLDMLRQMESIDPYPAAEYPPDAFSTDIKLNLKMKNRANLS